MQSFVPLMETAKDYGSFSTMPQLKRHMKLGDIMYLTAEPWVPDRGHCHTAKCTASTGLVKPKKTELDYDKSVWPEVRTFKEHRAEFSEQKDP